MKPLALKLTGVSVSISDAKDGGDHVDVHAHVVADVELKQFGHIDVSLYSENFINRTDGTNFPSHQTKVNDLSAQPEDKIVLADFFVLCLRLRELLVEAKLTELQVDVGC